jgi:pimeloyl-ACP methyl ester carboxylesterase
MAATPVFFLPGLLEDADAFGYQIERLRQSTPCTVADLTRAGTIAALAKEALQQAPEGRFALLGHSMGGYVALEVMRQAPDRVDRLALLNTNARSDTPEATANRRRLMDLAEKDFPEVIRTLIPKLLADDHVRYAEMAGTLTEMALATGKEAFLLQERAIIGRVDSRPHLGKIACPTLVLAARQDALMPVELLEELARGIPDSTFAIVEGSGHTSSIERPGEVLDLLTAWLEV